MGLPPPPDGPDVPPLLVLIAQEKARAVLETATDPVEAAQQILAIQAELDLALPGFSVTPPGVSIEIPQLSFQLPGFHFAAAFALKTPSFEFCGFGLPSFSFNLAFVLDLDLGLLFQFPPAFFFVLELPCGFAIPIGTPSGGGRQASPVPEFGAEFD